MPRLALALACAALSVPAEAEAWAHSARARAPDGRDEAHALLDAGADLMPSPAARAALAA